MGKAIHDFRGRNESISLLGGRPHFRAVGDFYKQFAHMLTRKYVGDANLKLGESSDDSGTVFMVNECGCVAIKSCCFQSKHVEYRH